MLPERRDELTSPLAYSANAVVQLANGVPRDLPLSRLLLVLEGRLTISAQTVAGVFFPEAPASLVRNITLQGTRQSGGGQVTLVSMRGEECHRISGFYRSYAPVGPDQADAPGSGGTAFPAPLANSANGSYDFRCFFEVPIALPFASIRDWYESILDPAIFSQLDLKVTFGSGIGNLVSGGTFTSALSAFGSASGSPQIRVTRFCPLIGGRGGIMKYHYQWITSYTNMGSGYPAAAQNTLIRQLNSGNKIRAIMLRQYAEASGVPGQIDQSASASLARIGDNSNVGIYRWRVKLDGSDKWAVFNPDQREQNRLQFGYFGQRFPQGYTILDFAPQGIMSAAWDARQYGQTARRFELHGDWTGETSADRLDVLQIEQIPAAK